MDWQRLRVLRRKQLWYVNGLMAGIMVIFYLTLRWHLGIPIIAALWLWFAFAMLRQRGQGKGAPAVMFPAPAFMKELAELEGQTAAGSRKVGPGMQALLLAMATWQVIKLQFFDDMPMNFAFWVGILVFVLVIVDVAVLVTYQRTDRKLRERAGDGENAA